MFDKHYRRVIPAQIFTLLSVIVLNFIMKTISFPIKTFELIYFL